MGKHSHTNSGLGGFMNGASIRFSKMKNGSGGVDAWRDQLNEAAKSRNRLHTRPRTTGTKLPKLQSIHEATITTVQDYGVFVQLGKGDVYKDGMCHVSNIGHLKIETPREAGMESGLNVWVKIKDLDEKNLKYSVDMRYVDQRSGKDLDPYHGMAKIVDNGWDRGVYALEKKKAEEEDAKEAPASPEEPATSSGTKRKADKSEESSVSDSSEAKEVSKKLKKARKKLEKMRKKAEKVKSKKDESDSDEKKKKKGKEKKKKKKKEKKDSSEGPGGGGGGSFDEEAD